jgi:hypothetical protein
MSKLFSILALICWLQVFSQGDTATIMYYNVLNYPGSTSSRVQYFRTVNQYAQPDIILITELISEVGAQILLQDGLNVFGETKYQMASFVDGYDSDNILFYNSEMFSLYSQDTIQTALRNIGEYVLYYKIQEPYSPMDTVFLYFYVSHLKAGTGSANEQQRLMEVYRYKQHVDANPGIENMFFGGDLNFYSSSEPAYSALISQGIYPLNDVLPAGNWQNNSAYSSIHTQSTRTASFGGGATGGLDDRFDFILFTDDVLSGSHRVTYLPGSCIPLGNDGQHLNLALIDPPANTSVPDSVIQALYYMSDHLPVISKVIIQPEEIQLDYFIDVKLFLEGPFQDSIMTTTLLPLLPLSQPYNQQPWNYFGNEAVSQIPPDVVDWVLIELRDAVSANDANASTTIARQAAFLAKDGSVRCLDGSGPELFNNLAIQHSLFITIWHRNHLGIMSASPAQLNSDIYSFDFTIGQYQTFGGLSGCVEVGSGKYGMIAGDSNGSGIIEMNDKTNGWQLQSGLSGYLMSDFNLDAVVENQDKDDYLLKNLQKASQVPQ